MQSGTQGARARSKGHRGKLAEANTNGGRRWGGGAQGHKGTRGQEATPVVVGLALYLARSTPSPRNASALTRA